MIRKLATEKGDDRKKSVECIVVNKQVQVYVQIKNGKGFIKQTKIKCNPFGCFVNNIPSRFTQLRPSDDGVISRGNSPGTAADML